MTDVTHTRESPAPLRAPSYPAASSRSRKNTAASVRSNHSSNSALEEQKHHSSSRSNRIRTLSSVSSLDSLCLNTFTTNPSQNASASTNMKPYEERLARFRNSLIHQWHLTYTSEPCWLPPYRKS